jgi:cell division protein FtsI (penicillin-binding protein 3)
MATRTYQVAGAPGARRKGGGQTLDRNRVAWVAALLCLWALLVVVRLVDLQILNRPEALRQARRQQEHTVNLDARRGRILDRAGRPLAESIEVPSLYAHPAAMRDPARAAGNIAPLVGKSHASVEAELTSGRNFVWLGRRLAPAAANSVHALNLAGVGEITESRRYYPGGRLAAHVLGFTGVDGQGLAGVEYRYNDAIKGRPGKMLSVRDGHGQDVLVYLEHPSSSGQDLYLTLDQVIQYHAEVELDRAMKETGSRWGTVVVMQPHTGAVLAMATRPSFNPNAYSGTPAEHLRNRAVSDTFEPGSTMKVFVAAEALERGLVRPNEIIDCLHGSIMVSGKRIRDHKIFDLLTFTDVIARSSNVGIIIAGSRLKPEALHNAYTKVGFGSRTGAGLPGESPGILHPPRRWSGVSQASMSIGQEIGVTALQLVRAMSAVANRGILPNPYIIKDGGGAVPSGSPPGKRVMKQATAETLNRMLEWTVQDGTGKLAAVPGYQVAGKTGTAQKPGPRGYGDDKVASFLGYVPSTRPELTMLVVLDSPQGLYHGGEVAAPVFARVATPVLRYLGVRPDDGTLVVDHTAPEVPEYQETQLSAAASNNEAPQDPVVPDVTGSSLPAALSLLARAGLIAEVKGSGVVVSQHPAPGTPASSGEAVAIRLATNPVQQAALR